MRRTRRLTKYQLERKQLFELKADAHDLIDELVAIRIPKPVIYNRLRIAMSVPNGFEHFGRMATVSQVEKGIEALTKMKNYYKRRNKKDLTKTLRRLKNKKKSKPNTPPPLPILKEKKSSYKRGILPLAQQKELLKNLNQRSRINWVQKIFNKLFIYSKRGIEEEKPG